MKLFLPPNLQGPSCLRARDSPMRHSLIVTWPVIALLGVHAASRAQDLVTAKAAVKFYTESVTSLQGKFVSRLESKPSSSSSLMMEDMTTMHDFKCDLARKWVRLDRLKSWKYSGISTTKPFEARSVMCFDGSDSYHLLNTARSGPLRNDVPSDVPNMLNIMPRDDSQIYLFPWTFAGLRLHFLGMPLYFLMGEPAAKVEGLEKVDGHECWRFTVRIDKGTFKAWLDPDLAFLPRKHVLETGKSDTVYSTLEFEQYPSVDGGVKFWFPRKCRAVTGSNDRVEELDVLELTVNPPLDKRNFQVEESSLPPGVKVSRERAQDKYTGGRKDLYEARQKLILAFDDKKREILGRPTRTDSLKVTPASNSNSNNVRVRSGGILSYWPVLLGGVSLLLVVFGLRAMRRSP